MCPLFFCQELVDSTVSQPEHALQSWWCADPFLKGAHFHPDHALYSLWSRWPRSWLFMQQSLRSQINWKKLGVFFLFSVNCQHVKFMTSHLKFQFWLLLKYQNVGSKWASIFHMTIVDWGWVVTLTFRQVIWCHGDLTFHFSFLLPPWALEVFEVITSAAESEKELLRKVLSALRLLTMLWPTAAFDRFGTSGCSSRWDCGIISSFSLSVFVSVSVSLSFSPSPIYSPSFWLSEKYLTSSPLA